MWKRVKQKGTEHTTAKESDVIGLGYYAFGGLAFVSRMDGSTKSYPAVTDPPVCASCGVSGGTGEPPESSDGVLDKNKFPPSSETNVMGELFRFEV